ncbi:AI-2E family transporter [Fictibacillus macauensis]|nr:AI-2E family transporter [Fictibacillus macauensis]
MMKLLKSENTKKVLALLLLVGILYMVKSLFNILLITFIFSYLFYNLQEVIYKFTRGYINRKLIAITIYLCISGLLVLVIVKYIPLLGIQFIEIGKEVSSFNWEELARSIDPRVTSLINNIEPQKYISSGMNTIITGITSVGSFSVQLFVSLLLSFFFLLEKNTIVAFGKKVETSKIGPLYQYYSYFGKNFLNSFGKVLQTQILISFINAVLSVIMLGILGFNQLFGLGVMIFLLGLIPVAGVVISFVPLAIIAFKIGGMTQVIWVVVMIIVLHALESYFLNPKLMSIRTKLPTFFTFLTLIVSEHFLGIWGLLIGLPLVMFVLDMLHITNKPLMRTDKKEVLDAKTNDKFIQ